MCSKRATLIAGSCGRLMPLSDVELSLWADILMAVLIAERFWCLTTRAGIDIALSVREINERSGYRTWSRKCSRSHTFTIVFTLPDSLNQLCLHQPKVVYDTLFKTAWSVIDSFGRDPKWLGAQFCILGDRNLTSTHIYIASFQVAALPNPVVGYLQRP